MVGRDRRSLPFSNNFCVFLLILYCTFHRRNTNVIVRFIHSISCEIIVSRTKCTCLSALVKTFSQNAKHNNTCHRRNENSITSCFHTKERLSRFFQKSNLWYRSAAETKDEHGIHGVQASRITTGTTKGFFYDNIPRMGGRNSSF
jgi:hypothetical protein